MPELIDQSLIDQMAQDIGAEAVPEVLQVFEQELVEREAFFATCRIPEQADDIQAVSHQLKSSAGSCGALRLQARAKTLNDALRAQTLDTALVERELAQVRALLPVTLAALQRIRHALAG